MLCQSCGYRHKVLDEFPMKVISACDQCPNLFINPDDPDLPTPKRYLGPLDVEDLRLFDDAA